MNKYVYLLVGIIFFGTFTLNAMDRSADVECGDAEIPEPAQTPEPSGDALIVGQEYEINPMGKCLRARETPFFLKATFKVLSVQDIPKEVAGKANVQTLAEEIEKRLTTEAGRLRAIPCMLKIVNTNNCAISFNYADFLKKNQSYILQDHTVNSLLGFRWYNVIKLVGGGTIAVMTYGTQAFLVPFMQSYMPNSGGHDESVGASYGYSPSAPYLTAAGIQTLCLGAAIGLLCYAKRQWDEISARYQVKYCLRKIEFAEGDSVIRSGETKRILFLVKTDQLRGLQQSMADNGLVRYVEPFRDEEFTLVIKDGERTE